MWKYKIEKRNSAFLALRPEYCMFFIRFTHSIVWRLFIIISVLWIVIGECDSWNLPSVANVAWHKFSFILILLATRREAVGEGKLFLLIGPITCMGKTVCLECTSIRYFCLKCPVETSSHSYLFSCNTTRSSSDWSDHVWKKVSTRRTNNDSNNQWGDQQ